MRDFQSLDVDPAEVTSFLATVVDPNYLDLPPWNPARLQMLLQLLLLLDLLFLLLPLLPS